MRLRLAFGLPLMCLFVGLIVFLAALPGARGSGRQLVQPPGTTAPGPVPTVGPIVDEVVGPSETVTEGVLLSDPLELVVADEQGLRILDLETGSQSVVDPSPDLRSLHEVGADIVLVDQGRARLGVGQGEQTDLGAAQRLLSSDVATRVWLIDAGSMSEVEPSGTVTRGPFPIPSGLVPRYSTRLWLVS